MNKEWTSKIKIKTFFHYTGCAQLSNIALRKKKTMSNLPFIWSAKIKSKIISKTKYCDRWNLSNVDGEK